METIKRRIPVTPQGILLRLAIRVQTSIVPGFIMIGASIVIPVIFWFTKDQAMTSSVLFIWTFAPFFVYLFVLYTLLFSGYLTIPGEFGWTIPISFDENEVNTLNGQIRYAICFGIALVVLVVHFYLVLFQISTGEILAIAGALSIGLVLFFISYIALPDAAYQRAKKFKFSQSFED